MRFPKLDFQKSAILALYFEVDFKKLKALSLFVLSSFLARLFLLISFNTVFGIVLSSS